MGHTVRLGVDGAHGEKVSFWASGTSLQSPQIDKTVLLAHYREWSAWKTAFRDRRT